MECEVCGNNYRDAFTVTMRNDTYAFDCFECAIHALAPTCAHCGCKIIGHGVAEEGEVFCSDHCVRMTTSTAAPDDDDDDDEDADEESDFEVDDEVDDDDDELDEDDDRDDDAEEAAPARRR